MKQPNVLQATNRDVFAEFLFQLPEPNDKHLDMLSPRMMQCKAVQLYAKKHMDRQNQFSTLKGFCSCCPGPVYMRPPLHSRVPSADIGALNLHEYFSPLSVGLSNPSNPPQSSHSSKVLQGEQTYTGSKLGNPTLWIRVLPSCWQHAISDVSSP